MTSARCSVSFGDVKLTDMAAAGLSAPSTVRAGKIATIEPHRILRRAGALAPADRAAVAAALKACAAF